MASPKGIRIGGTHYVKGRGIKPPPVILETLPQQCPKCEGRELEYQGETATNPMKWRFRCANTNCGHEVLTRAEPPEWGPIKKERAIQAKRIEKAAQEAQRAKLRGMVPDA